MQLVAYGAQDIYLTGNPQITFFKVVYRRHTNFAVESIEQTFNGSAELGKKFSCTISRNGDLLHRVYLEVELLATTGSVDNLYGFDLIDYVELEIGGQCIDKHYGQWMALWTNLTHNVDSYTMLENMMGTNTADVKNYIPLQFWFCRNPGLALPLIALQYHEVKINVQFVSATNGNNISNCCVFCDYIFLDTDERRRFAQVSHEYLIEQVQTSNAKTVALSATNSSELRFNHPVKELVWVMVSSDGTAVLPTTTNLLQLNGHDRFKVRSGSYFTDVQRYQHHTGSSSPSTAITALGDIANYTHVYSFALKPEEHQPSGTCNFSRIDNAVLVTVNGATAGTLTVYAVNYNVLRIMSGMGGLAYSN